MKFRKPVQPGGHRLFRVTLVTSVVALLVGGLVLLALWSVVDFTPEEGWVFARVFGVLGIILALGTLGHYPWSRSWCEALGSKYPD